MNRKMLEPDPFPPFREPTVLDETVRQERENLRLATEVERIVRLRSLPPPPKRK
jgi:hypothetical protein